MSGEEEMNCKIFLEISQCSVMTDVRSKLQQQEKKKTQDLVRPFMLSRYFHSGIALLVACGYMQAAHIP